MSFVLLGYSVMVVTSDFGSESPGSSPGSPTKRDNLMKAIKDKKKFGGTSLVPKNHNCRKFGYSYDKEVRRLWRMEAKRIAHKVLMHLPLMSSLESVSETRTDLIAYITDQLNNGVYKTVVIRDSVTNEITGEKEMRAKAQIVADTNSPSGYKRQETSPFSQYGITCGLVSILDIKYDGATQSQIDAQKQANLAVITSKTKSLEAIQRTVQITEEGRAAAERAKWEQEKEKAVAVTKAQQEFEVAELEAKKAKQVALKVQAEGEAKAAANRALVSAGLTPAERAEWDYKTAVGVAQALAESKVSWVPSVMFGGGSSSNSAMDAVGLKMLLDITKSFDKTSK